MWYKASIGIKVMNAIMIEWKGPRCSTNGISMSMSGITESIKTRGMFTFVLVAFAVNMLRRYPKARCPTANDLFSSSFV